MARRAADAPAAAVTRGGRGRVGAPDRSLGLASNPRGPRGGLVAARRSCYILLDRRYSESSRAKNRGGTPLNRGSGPAASRRRNT